MQGTSDQQLNCRPAYGIALSGTQPYAGGSIAMESEGPTALRAEQELGSMFTIVRKFTLRRGSATEVKRRVHESFVPLLRDLPGFRAYYLFDGGPDVLVSIRVFDSADEALASNEIAAAWIRNNVLEFTKGMPEVMAGEVLVAEFQAMNHEQGEG